MNRNTSAESGAGYPAMVSLNDRFDLTDRLVDEKFVARDRALSVAMASMDRRLDSMNAFREALRDQASRFLQRDEYLAAHGSIAHEMDGVRIELSKYAVRIEEYEKTAAVERAQLDKRLDSMNEFRLQLRDQAATFVTRNESDALTKAIAADVKRLEISASEKAGRDESIASFDRIDVRVKLVESKLANWDGRLWALGTIFLLINIFVSWYLSGIHAVH